VNKSEFPSLVMGVDGGQTKTTCLLSTIDGELLGEGRAGPIFHLAMKEGEERFLESVGEAIQKAWDAAGLQPRLLAAIGLGLTGVTGDSLEARKAAALAGRLVQSHQVIVQSDVYASLLSAHAGGEGIVVVSGTGSVAMGINQSGQVMRTGGWGWVMGDEGSACWIGRRGLSAALRAYDQVDPVTQLEQFFLEHFKVQAIHDIKRIYMASDFGARGFGSLAPVVAQAAKDGDGIAKQIIANAAHELALITLAITKKLSFEKIPVGIATIGGAFEHLWGLKEYFQNYLKKSTPEMKIVDEQFPTKYGPLILGLRACQEDLNLVLNRLRKSILSSHQQ
jgi:N-acetylglucosamine kinase-like BadF-type ATPase